MNLRDSSPATFVLVHGAWHTGSDFEEVAAVLRSAGHIVFCPTLRGNRACDDRRKSGLEDAISSITEFIEAANLIDVRLVGHSYAGIVISGVADRLEKRLRRLVYINGFVPLDGQSITDMDTKSQAAATAALVNESDNSLMIPFVVWREIFMNDADLSLARSTYDRLQPQPFNTFTDKISLRQPLAELSVGKSYINCQQDIVMPHSYPWHPRLSERLGLFRLVEMSGGHETLFTNPSGLAKAIWEASRD
jgi:pimeloyl-ACP methyl ester carboxylesterase